MNAISSEMTKLNNELLAFNKDSQQIVPLEKKAELMTMEMKALQGQLMDLNTLVDKLHSNVDVSAIEQLAQQLAQTNAQHSKEADSVFSQRQG
jgi:intraflagellar transport protein 74